MHTFRFNPVSKCWVMLGGSSTGALVFNEAHFFDIGKQNGFAAASYPKDQFLMEPPTKKWHSEDQHLLFAEYPAVGEHEVLLYTKEEELAAWEQEQWAAWLMLIQQRLLQVHHNPHLHFVYVELNTAHLNSARPYQRVGDILATSHPVGGAISTMDGELADKLLAKEDMFVVRSSRDGHLLVPSAPTHEKELWYIPKSYQRGFEQIAKEERDSLAAVLANVFPALYKEFPNSTFTVTIHTSVAGKSEDATWWLQLYENTEPTGIVTVRPFRKPLLNGCTIFWPHLDK